MFFGVGAAPAGLKKGALQMGAQQLGPAGLMPFPGFGEHGERLAQGGHGAGHQGGADRFHPIPPEQLEQLQ